MKYKHSVAVSNKQSAYIKIDSREISLHSFLFLSYSRVKWTKCWYVELGRMLKLQGPNGRAGNITQRGFSEKVEQISVGNIK